MYNTWKWSTGESYYKSARLEKSQNLNQNQNQNQNLIKIELTKENLIIQKKVEKE